jgi:hypothetical protein
MAKESGKLVASAAAYARLQTSCRALPRTSIVCICSLLLTGNHEKAEQRFVEGRIQGAMFLRSGSVLGLDALIIQSAIRLIASREPSAAAIRSDVEAGLCGATSLTGFITTNDNSLLERLLLLCDPSSGNKVRKRGRDNLVRVAECAWPNKRDHSLTVGHNGPPNSFLYPSHSRLRSASKRTNRECWRNGTKCGSSRNSR